MCNYTQRNLCNNDCDICFNRSFASSDKAECWSPENDCSPREIHKSSDKICKFICSCCKHPFEAALYNVTAGKWCPFCAGRKLCTNICSFCYEKSFASHPRASHWSSKNIESPRQVFKGSHKIFWFKCDCKHEFEASTANVTKGKWCPYCAGRKLCTDDCLICYEKSFASSDRADCWSSKNDLSPRDVFKSSKEKRWFDCKECGHDFKTSLNHVTTNESWCPFCGLKELCKDNKCLLCYDRSFASHLRAQQWSSKNKIKPREVFKSSHEEFWFDCEECGHDFEAILNNITNGRWCPRCKNKTEAKLCKWLEENNYPYMHQPTFVWAKKINFLPYDFLILDGFNIIIELDGSPEENYENDLFKTKKALENDYVIIRILQKDVLYDRNDWETKLKEAIRLYTKPACILLNNDDEYYKLWEGLVEVREAEGLNFGIKYR